MTWRHGITPSHDPKQHRLVPAFGKYPERITSLPTKKPIVSSEFIGGNSRTETRDGYTMTVARTENVIHIDIVLN